MSERGRARSRSPCRARESRATEGDVKPPWHREEQQTPLSPQSKALARPKTWLLQRKGKTTKSNLQNCAFVSILWGTSTIHQLEAVKLGMNLVRHSSRKRVLLYHQEIQDCGWFDILQSIWTMVKFEHLPQSGEGHARRLDKVYSKLSLIHI